MMPRHRRSVFRWMRNPISQIKSDSDALAWSVSTGAFDTQAEAQLSFDACVVLYSPAEKYQRWIDVVNRRRQAVQHRRAWRVES